MSSLKITPPGSYGCRAHEQQHEPEFGVGGSRWPPRAFPAACPARCASSGRTQLPGCRASWLASLGSPACCQCAGILEGSSEGLDDDVAQDLGPEPDSGTLKDL